MSNADALSRLPLSETINYVPIHQETYFESIIRTNCISRTTEKDPILARIKKIIQSDSKIFEVEAVLRPYIQKACNRVKCC